MRQGKKKAQAAARAEDEAAAKAAMAEVAKRVAKGATAQANANGRAAATNEILEEEEEEEDEEACMTLAVSPSISPSKKIDQHVISKSSNEDIAASTTPEKDSNDKFVFSKPALPSKPPKHAKHEESHKVKSCEKLARKEFLTPSIGSSGVVKPKKNGFSVPKKMH